MKNLLQKHIIAVCLSGMAVSVIPATHANAQGAPKSGWVKVCTKQEETEFCNVQYQVVASNGQVVTSVNLADIKGKVNRRIFQVTVPTGRVLPAGVKVQVDDKKAVILPYMFCFPEKCAAEVKMDDNLVKILKSGSNMTVTSVNYQNKPNPIKVSLEGFTQAYDGPAMQPNALVDRQKKLQAELQQKAEEERKKLQEAQEKSKK